MSKKSKIVVSIVLLFSLAAISLPGCLSLQNSKTSDGYTAIIPSILQIGIPQSISIALFKGDEPVNGNIEVVLSDDRNEILQVKNTIFSASAAVQS